MKKLLFWDKVFWISLNSFLLVVFIMWRYDVYLLDQKVAAATDNYLERRQQYKLALKEYIRDSQLLSEKQKLKLIKKHFSR